MMLQELREAFIPLDFYDGKPNTRALLQAVQWLRDGGVLIVFPAGSVSRFDMKRLWITDPQWQDGIAWMIEKSAASVLPMHVDCDKSLLNLFNGILRPDMRRSLVPRMILKQKGKSLKLRVAHHIPASQLLKMNDRRQICDYLRLRTYIIQDKQQPSQDKLPLSEDALARPIESELLEQELAALPAKQKLLKTTDCDILYCRAQQIPNTMLELGRLREKSYREVGEGTGKALDLTAEDDYYVHLIVWNRDEKDIVGAYRFGLSDEILPRFGKEGLYCHTLYNLDDEFIDRLQPGFMELGRSFVQKKYQCRYASLLSLWKGIGAFIAAHPRYRYLFGPVSISADYRPLSRQLLCQYLMAVCREKDLQPICEARTPLAIRDLQKFCRHARIPLPDNMTELDQLIADIENDHKGVPILIRQYLKLGGDFLAFNVDHDFCDVLDGFFLLDFASVPPRNLKKYMGPAAEDFRQRYLQSLQLA